LNVQKKILVSIDPGSTVCGYAIFRFDQHRAEFKEVGLLKAKATLNPYKRIEILLGDIETLLKSVKPHAVVIETTTGKVGGKRHKGGGAGLSIYGVAVGAIWISVLRLGYETNLIKENEWTGKIPKDERIENIALLVGDWILKGDPGGDAADAVGLGRYYLSKTFTGIKHV